MPQANAELTEPPKCRLKFLNFNQKLRCLRQHKVSLSRGQWEPSKVQVYSNLRQRHEVLLTHLDVSDVIRMPIYFFLVMALPGVAAKGQEVSSGGHCPGDTRSYKSPSLSWQCKVGPIGVH